MNRKRSTLPETPNERGGPSTSPPSSHIHSSEYTPNEFYNNGGQPRSPERRYTLQEQSTRDRRQRYQQYQEISPARSQQTQPHDLDDRLDVTGTEIEEEENTDFWQEAFVPKSGSNESQDLDALTSSNLTNEPSEKVNHPLRRSGSALETRKPKDYQSSESREAGKPSLLNHSNSINRPRPKTGGNNPMVRTDFEAEGLQPPQRSKSLVKPERARPIHRRNTFHRQDYDNEIEKPRLFDVSGDRRRLPERRNKKKWYQCELPSAWIMFSRCITCWAPPCLLSCFGLSDRLTQQAWREKIALVFIILVHCAAVGFLTFGITQAFCGIPPARVRVNELGLNRSIILGKVYDISGYQHAIHSGFIDDENLDAESNHAAGHDLSFLFQVVNQNCAGLLVNNGSGSLNNYFPCVPTDDYSTPNPLANVDNNGCHLTVKSSIKQLKYVGDLYYDWDYVTRNNHDFIVYNGQVLDLDRLQWTIPNVIVDNRIINLVGKNFRGRDVTYLLQKNDANKKIARCLLETIRVGVVDTSTIGCVITNVITDVSLIVIVAVVLVRFFLAVLFGWVLSWRLGNFREETTEDIAKRNQAIEKWENINNHVYDPNGRDSRISSSTSFNFMSRSRFSSQTPLPAAPSYRRREGRYNSRQVYTNHLGHGEKKFRNGSASSLIHQPQTNGSSVAANNDASNGSQTPSINETNSRTDSLTSSQGSYQNNPIMVEQRFNFELMHTILLVTCYSEGRQGIKTTLDSLAATDYPASHKIIMCIADGIIYGVGNRLSTPDICLSLMSDFIIPVDKVRAHSYVAIADGKKRHNMARVYAGYYKYNDHDDPQKSRRIPMITLVKCGGPGESDDPKSGNRGKRDSQMVLISFLQKVMFNERMTPLEYEFFNAIRTVSGVTPDCYELVLMVDADTKIFPDSLTRMVACMSRDPGVMGLCGETKIANKSDSWVTMIQVFEYYISHHMQKAFESIFGGVTCLPGCFCMYRIKAPKGPKGYWVPILANPDIVEHYSENIVNTLHKKNLLLLGEDRYLTTLMLRTFPKRKLVFVPQAVCKTIVPDTFKVLRSQRRRWINSTVHNLLELVLIPDLCGIFCFSMQFVIFMELVGTIVLPAAISFTMYLVVISIFERPIPYVPLALLAVVLGLPAILILLTTRKLIYVGWMIIYLFSLPIWNFILPVYAYWHFDDFSWGQTRVVEGEEAGADHSRKQGEFDSSKIVMKRWAEWEREKYIYYRNSLQRYIQSSSDDGYIPSSTRPSSSSTINGSEKSQIYQAQPMNSPLNPRGKRRKSHTTDSLMIPPPLSNNSTSDSDTNNSMPFPQGFGENVVALPQRVQRNDNSNNVNNTPSDNNTGSHSSSQYL